MALPSAKPIVEQEGHEGNPRANPLIHSVPGLEKSVWINVLV
jgi:hypothetical protein